MVLGPGNTTREIEGPAVVAGCIGSSLEGLPVLRILFYSVYRHGKWRIPHSVLSSYDSSHTLSFGNGLPWVSSRWAFSRLLCRLHLLC
jgi:hypothetical protein